METLRKNIDKRVKAKAASRLRKAPGGNSPKDSLGSEIQENWKSLYRKAEIRWQSGVRSGDLLRTLDEDQLRRLLYILNEEA